MMCALLLALAPCFVAQDPVQPDCAVCKDRGLVACRLCAGRPCQSELGYLYCSVEASCSDCGGAREIECRMCEHAPLIDVAAKRAAYAAWLESLAPFEEQMNHKGMVEVESAHFLLSFDVRRLDNKGASTPHDGAHLYVDRLERLFAQFQSDVGAEAEDFANKTHVMVWTSEKDQEKASSKYTLERTKTQAKLMGAEPVVSLVFGKGNVRKDEELHRALIHQVSHCLLSNLYGGVWVGNLKGGWLDEGVAFLYEVREYGDVENWCYLSEADLKPLKLGRFEAEVLERLDDAPDFTTLSSLDTVAMAPLQRIFAWSLCDYITRQHPGKLGAVLKQVKKQKPASDAIQTGLGLSLTDFQLDWKTWVRASYSAKAKR